MEQKQTFSYRTLSLSVAAAELGRAILRAGPVYSVRTVVLSSILTTIALMFLSALAGANAPRMARQSFAARCAGAVFLLWYLAEIIRTAVQIQQVCWEQFSSLAFLGLLPLFLWAGWSFGCGLFERMAGILWWVVLAGAVLCVLGLMGQLHWQALITRETARASFFPDVMLYPEYFSFPILCGFKNSAHRCKKSLCALPLVSALISAGYLLGTAMLFGLPQGADQNIYPGYELLRAWSFGGLSRFDAAFLLLWLAAALFRLCFLVRAVQLLCERMTAPGSRTGEVAG